MHIDDVRMSEDWQRAKRELGIRVDAPAEILLGGGTLIRVPALVHDFGAPRGTVVVVRHEELRPYRESLLERGYSYSSYGVPDLNRPFDRENTIDMLCEWGWSGEMGKQPGWYYTWEPRDDT